MTSRTPDIAVGTVIHGDTVASGTAISPDPSGRSSRTSAMRRTAACTPS
ncbi:MULTISPECIES: hypothetical protein [Streptomyces]|jgi:hypothetical protein|uniref:Uncharacterized protein n=1 Tax=Streptomyces himalayensis subsp. aureolus TaxID=2758039 RepID=A0A7W2D8N6_9ACTN|nr:MULTISPECIES: hypothetical protein [Streptomyces]MBA4866515.1 hypothetical protein [Streptomyces himalayensis subsp. aureolus]MCX5054528.1 hypothetical protein [Streptomyces sp. NBC_00474]MCX5063658.1 hypothetical protein [Streptomyces sp. NBC_00452]MCX5251813.1 hypothetical protein [Streptomyces sp. NBC_00201]MCX5294284.1 hypothetical protein [Streptomyces sp. NBC_00183]